MCIVPSSFLGSEFWERSRIRFIDRDFSFIGQTELDPDAFAGSGVEYFQTKVMMFMRSAHCIESRPYDAEGSVSWEELGRRIAEARELKRKLRLKLMQETKTLNAGEEMVFRYAVDKYLYELKTHKTHKKHHGKALALVSSSVTSARPRTPPSRNGRSTNAANLLTPKCWLCSGGTYASRIAFRAKRWHW